MMGNVEKILVAVIMTTIVVILALAIYGLGTDPGYMQEEKAQLVNDNSNSEPNAASSLPLTSEGHDHQGQVQVEESRDDINAPNIEGPNPDIIESSANDRATAGARFEELLGTEGSLENRVGLPGQGLERADAQEQLSDQVTRDATSWRQLDASPIEGTKIYEVRRGDTLSSIAHRFYRKESSWKLIQRYNQDIDPGRLSVGTQLLLPAPDSPMPSSLASVRPSMASASRSTYTVKKGDTLFAIAKKLLRDGKQWKAIYDQNRRVLAQPTDLQPGMTLVIP